MTDSIGNALLIATERPPDVYACKLALLTFDRVIYFNPNDRDIMPAEVDNINFWARGMPRLINIGGLNPKAHRRLGAVEDYQRKFDAFGQQTREFGEEKLLQLVPYQVRSNVPNGMIGFTATFPPPPFSRYIDYRWLAAHSGLVTNLALVLRNEVYPPPYTQWIDLALDCEDETFTSLEFPDANSTISFPPLAPAEIPGASDDERLVYSRLAWGRISSVVKCLHENHRYGLVPIADDNASAWLIRRLEALRTATVPDPTVNPGFVEKYRLGALHNIADLIVSKEKLTQMTARDCVKLRTKAWGNFQQQRRECLTRLAEIARVEDNPTNFEVAVKDEVSLVMDAETKWRREVNVARTGLLLKTTAAAAALETSSMLTQKFLSWSTWPELMLKVSIGLVGTAAALRPSFDAWEARRQAAAMPSYAIINAYPQKIRRAR